MIELRPLALDGVFEIIPPKFADNRGYFSETYNRAELARRGLETDFVQDNQSYSAGKGVVRGLHYQLPPRAQDKLVRVIRGRIFDVAIDIRRSSPTFGRWVGAELSEDRWNQLLVPKGFAHGFLTLEEHTVVAYKVSASYSPEHDRSIRYDDREIGIDWPMVGCELQLSNKDMEAPLLGDAEVF